MSTPEHVQVFGKAVSVSAQDARRLETHLRSWRKLNEMLILDALAEEDLKKLVILELLKDAPRRQIIERLIWRIGGKKQARIFANVDSILALK